MKTLPKFPSSVLHYGFTGTQKGMTKMQAKALCDEMRMLTKAAAANGQVNVLHHGDCIGSDEEAHLLAMRFCWGIVIHPPEDDRKRAFCEGAKQILTPKPYLLRNYDIAEAGVCGLLATPEKSVEQLRSGTWATIRIARRMRRPVKIFDRYGIRPPCTSSLI